LIPIRNLHPAVGWNLRVFRLERGLDFDRALYSVDDAAELRQHAIAGGIDEAAVMLLDERID
jgi:hypothetical protein